MARRERSGTSDARTDITELQPDLLGRLGYGRRPTCPLDTACEFNGALVLFAGFATLEDSGDKNEGLVSQMTIRCGIQAHMSLAPFFTLGIYGLLFAAFLLGIFISSGLMNLFTH